VFLPVAYAGISKGGSRLEVWIIGHRRLRVWEQSPQLPEAMGVWEVKLSAAEENCNFEVKI